MSLHIAFALTNAAAVAAAASSFGGPAQKLSTTDFGGTQHMRIARIGRIEIDLEADRSKSLTQVPCAAASFNATTVCYIDPAKR